jgi:protein O-mannosyl-transferase
MCKTLRVPALIGVALTVGTLAAYWPVRQAGFLNFDDPDYVTNNPDVFHGLTWHGVGWAFRTVHASNWHPLTWLSHMLDCSIFGEYAGGHHWVNVGFHAANACLLFLLWWRMTGALGRSAFVAALFALHPLHVESVAWISERKDVLSTFFALLTLLSYARYVQQSSVRGPKSRLWYGLALSCFILGLLSKPMLVTLPFVMLLLDYWPLQRPPPKTPDSRLKTLLPLVREKAPFFAFSVASAVVTFFAQKTGGAVVTMEKMPITDRLGNAVVSYAQYLLKTVWPSNLSVFYPFAAELWIVEVLLCLVILTALTWLGWLASRRTPAVLVGWLWFVGTLVPVIGLVQVGSQAFADRYTYLPHIGLFVAVAWGVADLTAGWHARPLALALGSAVALTGCFVCTQFQVWHWKNSLTLFTHALQVTRDNPLAEHNLGHALSLIGDQREALYHFNRALRLKPGDPKAHFNRGNLYGVQGRLEEAMADYREAIRHKPDYEQAYCNLAKALAQQSRFDEAHTNFLAALRCKPDYAEAHTKLGNVLLLQGRVEEAMSHLRQAVRMDPAYAEGHYHLAAALARQKKFAEAAASFHAALRASSAYADAANDLAWLLATCPEPNLRNVPEAVRLAQLACELTRYTDPMHLDTLGVAHSEAGQFKEAITWTEKAIALATAAGDAALAAQLRPRLTNYQAGRSYTRSLDGSGAAR